MAKRKKKLYNPFKMWGSYLIAILSFLITLFFTQITLESDNLFNLSNFGVILFMTLFGFLIGWGIHSLWRKYN